MTDTNHEPQRVSLRALREAVDEALDMRCWISGGTTRLAGVDARSGAALRIAVAVARAMHDVLFVIEEQQARIERLETMLRSATVQEAADD